MYDMPACAPSPRITCIASIWGLTQIFRIYKKDNRIYMPEPNLSCQLPLAPTGGELCFVVKNSPRITCITSIRSNSYPCRYERYAGTKSFVATGDLTPLSNHPLHENREEILLPPCASYLRFVGTECASNLPL